MTTCEQAKNEGVQSAESDIAPGSDPPEASVEKLGQLFNTLEILDQAKSAAPDRAEGLLTAQT